MSRHPAPGFNYTLKELPVYRYPGEPRPVDPRAATKRRIEVRKEILALQKALAWPDKDNGGFVW